MGIIESMALIPVCSGSVTGCRAAMPGATMSSFCVSGLNRSGPCRRAVHPVDRPRGRAGRHRRETSSRRLVDRTTSPSRICEVVAVDHGADRVGFQVHGLAHDRALVGFELEEFAGHGLGQAVDPGDAVSDLDDASNFGDLQFTRELFDLLLDDSR